MCQVHKWFSFKIQVPIDCRYSKKFTGTDISREKHFFLLNTTWNLTCVKYINCIHLGFKFHIDSTTNKFMGTKITQENQIINTTPPLQTVISIIIDMKIEVLLKVSR